MGQVPDTKGGRAMSEFGMMGVDWEERINFERLRRERLQKAREAMKKADVDALFIFHLEDVRYVTGFRSLLSPVAHLGRAAAVLPRDGEPILCTMDMHAARAKVKWLSKENILGQPTIRSEEGTQKWAAEIKSKLGKLAEGKLGVDIWTKGLSGPSTRSSARRSPI
jgi:Xaa-Pro aminopeptidase